MKMEDLKALIKEGKAIVGTDESIKNLKQGNVKKVFITSNCPQKTKDQVKKYAKLSNVKVEELEVPNDELGVLCRKPFPISVLAVKK